MRSNEVRRDGGQGSVRGVVIGRGLGGEGVERERGRERGRGSEREREEERGGGGERERERR